MKKTSLTPTANHIQSYSFSFTDKNYLYNKSRGKTYSPGIRYEGKYYGDGNLYLGFHLCLGPYQNDRAIPDSIIDKIQAVKGYEKYFINNSRNKEFCLDVFCRNATFEEIFQTPHRVPGSNWLLYVEEDHSKDPVIPDCPDLNSLAYSDAISEIKDNSSKYVQMLESIRDHPSVLRDKFCMPEAVIIENLIYLIKVARWSAQKKDAEYARRLLEEHLIPRKPGGKRPLPSRILLDLILDLTKRLAQYLSKKCKSVVDCFQERNGDCLNNYDYETLIEWANKNTETRISNLTISELSTLIYKPSHFAKRLLEAHLNTSLKTVTRKK